VRTFEHGTFKSENQRPTDHLKIPVSLLTEAQLLKCTDEY